MCDFFKKKIQFLLEKNWKIFFFFIKKWFFDKVIFLKIQKIFLKKNNSRFS